MDIVSRDDQVIFFEQFDFRAPTPVRSARGIGITAEDGESVVSGATRAEHDGGVVMEGVPPNWLQIDR